MIFESQYRRQALKTWESSRQEVLEEFRENKRKTKGMTAHPLIAFVLALFADINK